MPTIDPFVLGAELEPRDLRFFLDGLDCRDELIDVDAVDTGGDLRVHHVFSL